MPGANLGSALNPLFEGAGTDPAARRLPVGNLVNRLVGCALVLPFLHPIAAAVGALDPNPARQIADFHTGFNLVLALLFIAPLDVFARSLTWLLPARPAPATPDAPLYLDETAIPTPPVALANAARETLPMGDRSRPCCAKAWRRR